MGELPLEEGAHVEEDDDAEELVGAEVDDLVAAYIRGRPPGEVVIPRPSRPNGACFRDPVQPRRVYQRAPTRRVGSL